MEDLYCIGCGVKLQIEDENNEGYVDPRAFNRETILCKRCYQLKHYGKFVEANAKNTITLLHKNVSKDDLVILIFDVALCYAPLINVIQELNSYPNLLIIANRFDLYSSITNLDKSYKFINKQLKKFGLHYKKVFIVNDNIDEIFDYIDNNSINKNAYLVGLENAGKTTFINKILKAVANEDNDVITNSRYPGTTIDLIRIPLDDNHYLIDSPGIKSNGNLLNYVDFKFIKDLKMDNKITPIIFQTNPLQSFLISNVCKLDFLSGNRQSIVIYGSNQLDIIRAKIDKSEQTFNNRIPSLHVKTSNVVRLKDLHKTVITIKDDVKKDIVIEGLCFITVKKGEYAITTFSGVNVYVRDSFI